MNAVTPPKDQGAYLIRPECVHHLRLRFLTLFHTDSGIGRRRYGYCWAFGASGSLEGMNVVQQKNALQSLSEQELVDCCHECWGHGPQSSWNYLLNNTRGYDSTEASYP